MSITKKTGIECYSLRDEQNFFIPDGMQIEPLLPNNSHVYIEISTVNESSVKPKSEKDTEADLVTQYKENQVSEKEIV